MCTVCNCSVPEPGPCARTTSGFPLNPLTVLVRQEAALHTTRGLFVSYIRIRLLELPSMTIALILTECLGPVRVKCIDFTNERRHQNRRFLVNFLNR